MPAKSPTLWQPGLGLRESVAAVALACFAALLLLRPGAMTLFPLVVALALLVVGHRVALSWPVLVGSVLVVVLFIPIRRFDLAIGLPIRFEPYRMLVAFVLVGWIAALLVDPRVRLRSTPLDLPLLSLVFVSALSLVFNADRIYAGDLSGVGVKQLLFLVSFVLVFFLLVSVVRSFGEIETTMQVVVVGGALLGVLATVEYWTGFNLFSRLPDVIPFLRPSDELTSADLQRFGRLRVYGSAQHPIALGALLMMLIPPSLYFARRSRLWYVMAMATGLGAAATLSRTAVVMGLTALAVMAALKWGDVKVAFSRTWIYVLPVALVMHFALPGAIGSFKELFFPSEGLIAEQSDGSVGSSRGASFGPGVQLVKEHAVLGVGYGTRIVTGPKSNSFIVDNQWLSTAMETGLLGLAAMVWFFGRALWVLGRAARRDPGDRGWLLAALAASIAAYAAGMATYDAMSFIQVTFILFVLTAVGCCAALLDRAGPHAAASGDAPRGRL